MKEIIKNINHTFTVFYGKNFTISKEWALFEIILTGTTCIAVTIAIAVICLPVRISVFILDAIISFIIKPSCNRAWAFVTSKYKEVRA